VTGTHRDETGEFKSLEETVLENIDRAATTAEAPAMLAIQQGIFIRNVVIVLAFYTALVAAACTYAIWKVQEQAQSNTDYLIQGCYGGNNDRAREKSLWDTLFFEDARVAEQLGEKITKEERAALKRIEDAVILAYPQIDCTRVDNGDRVVITKTPNPEGGP
jgi:hypothetical protein